MKSASLPGSVMFPGQRLQLVGEQGRKRHDLLEVVLDVPLQGVDLETVVVRHDLFGGPNRRTEERFRLADPVQRHAREPLDDEPQAAVRQLEHLVDVRDGADGVEIVLAGLFRRRLALGEDADELVAFDGGLDELHGTLPGHRQRHEGVGKQYRVAQRQDRQLRRNRHLSPARRSSRCVRMFRFVVHRAASARQPARSANNDTAPRRSTCMSRSSATSRTDSQSVQRTAKGNARRRRLEISFPHS